MTKSPTQETDSWRILLFGRSGSELLVFRGCSGFRLPELQIPSQQRIAPNLNAEAKRLWKLDTISLFPLPVDHSNVPASPRKYHVMEVCRPEHLARLAPHCLLVSDLREASFADRQDFLAVQRGMRLDGASFTQEECRGPFSEFGSFQKICEWVKTELLRLGLSWDGSFRQLQASASFALIRFQTRRGAAWFKAVGEPLAREFPITAELTARFPSYLPVSIATCTQWNAWLTREADGQDLFDCAETNAWQQTAASLSELQISSLRHTPDILAAGARDVRSSRLLALTDSFFQALERVMERQTKASPPPLHAAEINDVKEHVVSALQRESFTRLPDTLNHLDPNPGNIFVCKEKCTFLDWAEASVGNPFFTFEYLRQHFRRAFPGDEGAEAELCNSYLSRWRSILPGKTAEQMLLLAPLTALFAFASTLPWDQVNLPNQPERDAYLRSLGRRMHRESELLKNLAGEQLRQRSKSHDDHVAGVPRASNS